MSRGQVQNFTKWKRHFVPKDLHYQNANILAESKNIPEDIVQGSFDAIILLTPNVSPKLKVLQLIILFARWIV